MRACVCMCACVCVRARAHDFIDNTGLYFKYILLYWLYSEPCIQKAGESDFNHKQVTKMTHTKIWQLFIQTKPQQVLFKTIQYYQLLNIQINDQCIKHSLYALQTKNMLYTCIAPQQTADQWQLPPPVLWWRIVSADTEQCLRGTYCFHLPGRSVN